VKVNDQIERAMHAEIESLRDALRELVNAISKRWDGETERKRSNAISPRMEEAIAAARVALRMREGDQ
jgi:hypothetical protein